MPNYRVRVSYSTGWNGLNPERHRITVAIKADDEFDAEKKALLRFSDPKYGRLNISEPVLIPNPTK